MLGGWTCSDAASSPSVGVPNRSTVAKAETWEDVTPPATCWRSRRESRVTASRSRAATSASEPAGAGPRSTGSEPASAGSGAARVGGVLGEVGPGAIVLIVHHSN